MAALLLPIWVKYGYLPGLIIDVTNAELVKYAANHQYTLIFYYSGHGGYDDKRKATFLAPAINEWVYPGDIEADGKIVFINGCNSYPPIGLESAFDIDGNHEVK